MAHHVWPADTVFTRLELEPQNRACPQCAHRLRLCDHRHRRLFTLDDPLQLVCKLAYCPDQDCRGVTAVAEELAEVRQQAERVAEVNACLGEATQPCAQRQAAFEELRQRFQTAAQPFTEHLAELMGRWQAGLFAGGDDLELPGDNLELERWFRQPKGHARRIHGRAQGVRHRSGGTDLAAGVKRAGEPSPAVQGGGPEPLSGRRGTSLSA